MCVYVASAARRNCVRIKGQTGPAVCERAGSFHEIGIIMRGTQLVWRRIQSLVSLPFCASSYNRHRIIAPQPVYYYDYCECERVPSLCIYGVCSQQRVNGFIERATSRTGSAILSCSLLLCVCLTPPSQIIIIALPKFMQSVRQES